MFVNAGHPSGSVSTVQDSGHGHTPDPRVDAYIDASLPGWQQDICRQVRELVHAADPEVAGDDQADGPALFRAGWKHLRGCWPPAIT